MQEKSKRSEQARSRATKSAIIDAALVEFAHLGFDGATTRAIATRAEVNPALIAHHFGNKDDLWRAVAEHLFGMYAKRIQLRREGLTGVDRPTLTRLILREFILMSAEVPEFHRFMMQANLGDSERMDWVFERFLYPGAEAEATFLGDAQEYGLVPGADPRHLRFLFIGAATSIFTFSKEFEHLIGDDPFNEEVVDRHVDLVLRVFWSPEG